MTCCVFSSCGAALVAGMPLCAVPVHSGRWGAGGEHWVQETERRRPAPNRRHEPLLERDQTQIPQYPVRSLSNWRLRHFGKMCSCLNGWIFSIKLYFLALLMSLIYAISSPLSSCPLMHLEYWNSSIEEIDDVGRLTFCHFIIDTWPIMSAVTGIKG